MRRSTETFHGRVCGKIFISGKAAKLMDRYDPGLLPTQNLGHQSCVSFEKLQAYLEVAAKRDERARGRELKRVAGERERQLWEEIESKKTNNWWTRSKGYRHFLRGRISRGHQAQQHRLCFAFAEVKLSISTCVGAGTSGFWTQLPEKTSEFSETWSPSLRFSIVSSRSAFIFLADLKLISRTREYSTLFAELGSTKGHLSCVQESFLSTFVQASR